MKFRIGNHKLMIENGRYDKTPRNNRLCPTCVSNQIEDKIHLLFYCPKYSILRDGFYRKIEFHLPNIKQLSPKEANKELMNSSNYFVNTLFFCKNLFYKNIEPEKGEIKKHLC